MVQAKITRKRLRLDGRIWHFLPVISRETNKQTNKFGKLLRLNLRI